MKAAESALLGIVEKEVFFPEGLLGFADCRRYKFRRFDPGGGNSSPFIILESTEHELSFSLIHPDFVWPD